jgi:hypothetical protein
VDLLFAIFFLRYFSIAFAFRLRLTFFYPFNYIVAIHQPSIEFID